MARNNPPTVAESLAKTIISHMSRSDLDVLEDELAFGSNTLHQDLAILLDEYGISPTHGKIAKLKAALKDILRSRYYEE